MPWLQCLFQSIESGHGASDGCEALDAPPYDPRLPTCRQVELDPAQELFLAVWGDCLAVHGLDGQPAEPICPEEGLRAAWFTPDGDHLLLGTRDDRALLVDRRDGAVLCRSHGLGDYLDVACWLPDGRQFVGVTRSNRVAVQDARSLETRRCLLQRDPDETYEPLVGLVLSPDGARAYLAAGCRVRCLDTADGRPIWSAKLDHPLESIAIAAQGSRLALSSRQGVTLLDAATGIEVATSAFRFRGIHLPGARIPLAFSPRLAFSPDGQLLAASTPNGQLLLLDPANLELLREYPRMESLAWIEDMIWFADSQRLLVGCAHNRVAIWSVPDDRPLLVTQLT